MFYEFMQQGGPAIMWPIAGLSFLATCFVFERLYFWAAWAARRDRALRGLALKAPRSADLEAQLARDPLAEALYWLRFEPAKGRELSWRLAGEVRRGLSVLENIATISTSLGLFGTVVGVSMSFDSMAKGNAASVAGGLSVALYTTVIGLIVYLWCYVALAFFRTWSDRVEETLETAGA